MCNLSEVEIKEKIFVFVSGIDTNNEQVPSNKLLPSHRLFGQLLKSIIDPEKLDVNTPITAARYDGDGSGLFNIPANALEDLQLDRIKSGSAQAVISPNLGLVVNTKASISQSLSVSGGLFVTGGNITLNGSGSTFVGDGSSTETPLPPLILSARSGAYVVPL